MKQTVLFQDLGNNRSYKQTWDLQESLLQENVRLKAEKRSAVSSHQSAGSSQQSVTNSPQSAGGHLTRAHSPLTPDNSLLTPDHSPLTPDHSPLTPDNSLLTPANSPLTPDHSPLTTHHSPLTPHTSHLTTHHSPLTTVNRQLSASSINHLLFVQHNPVYTLGKSGNIDHVLIGEKEREQKGIEFFKINRGGDITFHGPGQLVGYPILDLEYFKTDLGWYLRNLEEVIIITMAEYGLKGNRSKGETGVWLDADIKGSERKICAIGIRCSRWITMHGFAFNVNTDLEYFNYIIPCGIRNKQVTSMQKELGYEISMAEVKQKVKNNFGKVFNVKFV